MGVYLERISLCKLACAKHSKAAFLRTSCSSPLQYLLEPNHHNSSPSDVLQPGNRLAGIRQKGHPAPRAPCRGPKPGGQDQPSSEAWGSF